MISLLAVLPFASLNFINAKPEKEFNIPSYIDVCYRDDPKVSECLIKQIQKLLPLFKNGSEDFNLEPLDPMYFDVINLEYKSGIIGGTLNVSDAYIHGLSNSTIKDVRPELGEPEKLKMAIDVHVPYLNVKSNYKLKGNAIKVPIDAKGRIDILFENLNVTYHISGNVKTIDEYNYLIIEKFTWNLHSDGIRKATIQNKDVVDGKPALNRLVRTVVNSNWKLLFKQLLPVVLPESDKKLKSIFSKFFESYPYDIIFPKKTRKDEEKKPEEKESEKD